MNNEMLRLVKNCRNRHIHTWRTLGNHCRAQHGYHSDEMLHYEGLFCVYGRHLALRNALWLFQRHTSACQVSSSARGSRSAFHLTCAATARMTVAMERTRQTAVRPSFHLYFNTFIVLWFSLAVLKAAFVLACFCGKGLDIKSDAGNRQVFCAMM